MNFFEQQDRAQAKTKRLIALFILVVLITCLLVWYVFCSLYTSFAIASMPIWEANIYTEDFWAFSAYLFYDTPLIVHCVIILLVLAIILGGCLSKLYEIVKRGSASMVEMLGGKVISLDTQDASEKILLNVVAEMSLASSIPMPPVYILEDYTINAFVMGLSYDDAVIGVTRGALRELDRNELQGVIAHEFSHIFSGDMTLNTRMIGMLNGVMFVHQIGKFILKSDVKSDARSSGAFLVYATGGILWLIGLAGLFLGSFIKALVNKEREYLADATAVKFTLFPQGLSGALKKILVSGSILNSPRASELSHLYFSNGVSDFFAFDTHPPLVDRILAIEPMWDGNCPPPPLIHPPASVMIKTEKKKADEAKDKKRLIKTVTTAALLAELDNIGVITKEGIAKAHDKIRAIPLSITESVANSLEAQFIIFGIMICSLDSEEDIPAHLEIVYEYLGESAVKKFDTLYRELKECSRESYLDIVLLSLASLKKLTSNQYDDFKETLNKLIEADGRISWFEFNIRHIVLYTLDIYFGIKKAPTETHSHIGGLKPNLEVFYSYISFLQFGDDNPAREVFRASIKEFGWVFDYIPFRDITTRKLEDAYTEMRKAKLPIRKKLLSCAISCMKGDGKFSAEEAETMHALASALRLPLER